MGGPLNELFAAAVLFVGGHFLLSSDALRRPLVARLGQQNFLTVYSLVALGAFVWMLFAYGRARGLLPVWSPPPALRWVPLVVMPIALVLAVAGLTTRSPTAVGGEAVAEGLEATHDPAPGILRVTRHPFLWSAVLWAASHLLVNGDAASMVLMIGILVLAVGGMRHIDRRREAALGSAWGPIALTTSVLPFAAIAAGRTTMDWPGIGWWRPILGLVLYAVVLHLHGTLFAVSPLPV